MVRLIKQIHWKFIGKQIVNELLVRTITKDPGGAWVDIHDLQLSITSIVFLRKVGEMVYIEKGICIHLNQFPRNLQIKYKWKEKSENLTWSYNKSPYTHRKIQCNIIIFEADSGHTVHTVVKKK